jgi:Fic family protein
MNDSNWELINGPDAHQIEFINHGNTINVIEALILFYSSVGEVDEKGCHLYPTARILKELHRTGTLFLLESPGEYRENYNVVVNGAGGVLRYQPPPWEQVEALMAEFHEDVARMWADSDRVHVAAYSLWRINWIHPFKNGNGRSARSFAYACLCLKFAAFLPGNPTVLDMIMTDRDPYEAALKHADDTYADTGVADIGPIKDYLGNLLIKQLSSI